jgi:hypothetical protein
MRHALLAGSFLLLLTLVALSGCGKWAAEHAGYPHPITYGGEGGKR